VTSVALGVSQILRTVWTSRRHGALLGQNEVTHGSDERSAWWRWSCSRKLTHACNPAVQRASREQPDHIVDICGINTLRGGQ
jgi:hypothetical protein